MNCGDGYRLYSSVGGAGSVVLTSLSLSLSLRSLLLQRWPRTYSYFRYCHGIIACFDLSDRSTSFRMSE